jgi:hypothetical protein
MARRIEGPCHTNNHSTIALLMMTFKKLETILQTIAVLVILFLLAAFQNRFSFDNFIPAYFIMGGYQLLSTLINAFLPFKKSPLRKVYYGLLILIIISGVIFGLAGDQIIGYLFVMLFFTPMMALFYLVICYRESYPRTQSVLATETPGPDTVNEE